MKFQVWVEGYAATGESAKAALLGVIQADSFQEACDKVGSHRKDYNAERREVWGCRLFDNEADARKAFG